MDNKSFWLANIGHDSLTVTLVSNLSGQYKVAAIGSDVLYQSTPDSFVAAIDQSLSESAASISLPEADEPNSIALIISPFWVGSDGRIVADKLKLFESMFKDLKLQPMGFISYDDAIVEEANLTDGYPASFILVNIESTSMIVSLSYLGKVIERIDKKIPDSYEPDLLESTLLEFNTDSALPPQIILMGDVDDEILEKTKNYLWIGKKNIETFLHFPEIKKYTTLDLNTIYTKAITSQFQPPVDVDGPEEEIAEEPVETIENKLEEVDPDDLGFTEGDNFTIPEPVAETESVVAAEVIPPPPKRPSLKIPKLKLPHISFPKLNFLLYPIVISPLLILLPFFLATAHVTLYLNPYLYSKTITVTLDPNATSLDAVNKIIPVNLKTSVANISATIATTGKKTIGQKAQGDITIFNKLDKVQNLPKGTVLIDSQGNKYELTNQVQVASSSSDLSVGVINLGKTNGIVIAQNIGPEFNLGKDAPLNFKDFNSTSLIAKVSVALTGGNKSEVNAVSIADKTNIEKKLNSQLADSQDTKDDQSIAIVTKNGRIDYGREVGEEADELTATIQTTVNKYSISRDQKLAIINSFLLSEAGFNDSIVNPDDFSIKLNPTKNNQDKITGPLTIEGKSFPKVNTSAIASLISGKFVGTASKILQKYPRVYNFTITTGIPSIPLPFRLSNIKIEVK